MILIDSRFDEDLYLKKPVHQAFLNSAVLDEFDKDGYEISSDIERDYYQANKVVLNREIQKHTAPVKPWYYDPEDPTSGIILDHSMLLQRYGFAEEALEQLIRISEAKPIFNKLVNIRPKWGLDFSVDYVDHSHCLEILHFEYDYLSYDEANLAKERLEQIINNIDWLDATNSLIARKYNWMNLSSDDQSDYKARFFGLHRAFDNKKVFL